MLATATMVGQNPLTEDGLAIPPDTGKQATYISSLQSYVDVRCFLLLKECRSSKAVCHVLELCRIRLSERFSICAQMFRIEKSVVSDVIMLYFLAT